VDFACTIYVLDSKVKRLFTTSCLSWIRNQSHFVLIKPVADLPLPFQLSEEEMIHIQFPSPWNSSSITSQSGSESAHKSLKLAQDNSPATSLQIDYADESNGRDDSNDQRYKAFVNLLEDMVILSDTNFYCSIIQTIPRTNLLLEEALDRLLFLRSSVQHYSLIQRRAKSITAPRPRTEHGGLTNLEDHHLSKSISILYFQHGK
jgi:hypothetical protein